MSDQRPWPLYPRERTTINIEQEAGRFPKKVWYFWRREICVGPVEIRTPDRQVCILDATLSTISRLCLMSTVPYNIRIGRKVQTFSMTGSHLDKHKIKKDWFHEMMHCRLEEEGKTLK